MFCILFSSVQVGADGGNSLVRRAFNMPSIGFSYNQKGIVATVRLKSPISTAVQRFLSTGPVACLPVSLQFTILLFPLGNSSGVIMLRLCGLYPYLMWMSYCLVKKATSCKRW